jgi:DNA invertase Pin-like site-specific DNA recombinase
VNLSLGLRSRHKIRYSRVSTKDQTVAMQVDALTMAGCAKVHTEVMSGSRSDRPI